MSEKEPQKPGEISPDMDLPENPDVRPTSEGQDGFAQEVTTQAAHSADSNPLDGLGEGLLDNSQTDPKEEGPPTRLCEENVRSTNMETNDPNDERIDLDEKDKNEKENTRTF